MIRLADSNDKKKAAAELTGSGAYNRHANRGRSDCRFANTER